MNISWTMIRSVLKLYMLMVQVYSHIRHKNERHSVTSYSVTSFRLTSYPRLRSRIESVKNYNINFDLKDASYTGNERNWYYLMWLRRMSPCLCFHCHVYLKALWWIDQCFVREAVEQARVLAWYYNSLKNSKHLPILENENVLFCQIVNKDSNTPQAKKIFQK